MTKYESLARRLYAKDALAQEEFVALASDRANILPVLFVLRILNKQLGTNEWLGQTCFQALDNAKHNAVKGSLVAFVVRHCPQATTGAIAKAYGTDDVGRSVTELCFILSKLSSNEI